MSSYSPDNAPVRVTIVTTPLYRIGPAQQERPDEYLRKGTVVQLVRTSLGYTLVRKEDGTTGYVPNENLAETTQAFRMGNGGPALQGQIAAIGSDKKKSGDSDAGYDFSGSDDLFALPQDELPLREPMRTSPLLPESVPTLPTKTPAMPSMPVDNSTQPPAPPSHDSSDAAPTTA